MMVLLNFSGSNYLRQRLCLAILSGRSIRITDIRANSDESPGLHDGEVRLLHLIDEITNGSKTLISETGTVLTFHPGTLIGGDITFECPRSRNISYYLEFLLWVAPFGKQNLSVKLRGITNNLQEPSVDRLSFAVRGFLKHFLGSDDGFEIKVLSRSVLPSGIGEVQVSCPRKQKLRPVLLNKFSHISKIRGVAWGSRVAPGIINRLISSARQVLNQFLPDIYIYSDCVRGNPDTSSPGFGITLYSQTTEGFTLCAEACSNPKGSSDGPSDPEELGALAANRILSEIHNGGNVDSSCHGMALLFMVIGQPDVSKLLLGHPTDYAKKFLKHVKQFYGVTFKIDDFVPTDDTDDIAVKKDKLIGNRKYVFTCLGAGVTNLNKVMI